MRFNVSAGGSFSRHWTLPETARSGVSLGIIWKWHGELNVLLITAQPDPRHMLGAGIEMLSLIRRPVSSRR